MRRLNTLKLSGLIRSQINSGDALFTPMITVSEDLKNLYEFSKDFEGVFINSADSGSINIRNGLDGRNMFASKITVDGFLFNQGLQRPKTISECIVELYRGINTGSSGSSVSAELALIKNAIGLAHFHQGVSSSGNSIDSAIMGLEKQVDQLASDVFNRKRGLGHELDSGSYAFNLDGKQTQSKSIKDLLFEVVDLHGGLARLNHDDVTSTSIWASVFSPGAVISGSETGFMTVFSCKNEASSVDTEQRFYNPYTKPLLINSGSVVIEENSLVDISSITLTLNGLPSTIDIKIRPGEIGRYNNSLTPLVLLPGDYVQFIVKTGSVPSGAIKISNLSLIIQET